MFIDQAKIIVKAGDGGKGCLSFRREKYIPRGGPDGGNGGRGGDVIIEASRQLNTLLDFHYRHLWPAGNGERGKGRRKSGKSGKSIVFKVPVGTLVKEKERAKIYDLVKDNEKIIIAQGGKGGRGNAAFVTSTQRAPRFAEDGQPGEKKVIELELKLIADVGLVGCPNSGKSTLLRKITQAKPKVAAYPFTTLRPYLGLVRTPKGISFILADIPGLLKGAHQGIGLGDEFLRHIERTHLLIYLIDLAGVDGRCPLEDFYTLRNELKSYKVDLSKKTFFIGLNKIDLPQAQANLEQFKREVMVRQAHHPEQSRGKEKVYPISALTGQGVLTLMEAVGKALEKYKEKYKIGSAEKASSP